MTGLSRRNFLALSGSAAAAALTGPATAAMGPNDKFDLVIKGGQKFLVVKRSGADGFRVTANVSVPSTNTVDAGGGMERTLD